MNRGLFSLVNTEHSVQSHRGEDQKGCSFYVEHERKTFRGTKEKGVFLNSSQNEAEVVLGKEIRSRKRKCYTARNGYILEDAYSFLLSSYLTPPPPHFRQLGHVRSTLIQREGRVRVKNSRQEQFLS
jgi:hypothetical protein